jgi:hypothetical protein
MWRIPEKTVTENDADTPETALYRVKATVTDTEGHNVDAGEQFNHMLVTGPDEESAREHFREHCADHEFAVDSSLDVERMAVDSFAELEAWLDDRMDDGDELGHEPLWNDMTEIPIDGGESDERD